MVNDVTQGHIPLVARSDTAGYAGGGSVMVGSSGGSERHPPDDLEGALFSVALTSRTMTKRPPPGDRRRCSSACVHPRLDRKAIHLVGGHRQQVRHQRADEQPVPRRGPSLGHVPVPQLEAGRLGVHAVPGAGPGGDDPVQ